jgi:hypothetical protein
VVVVGGGSEVEAVDDVGLLVDEDNVVVSVDVEVIMVVFVVGIAVIVTVVEFFSEIEVVTGSVDVAVVSSVLFSLESTHDTDNTNKVKTVIAIYFILICFFLNRHKQIFQFIVLDFFFV